METTQFVLCGAGRVARHLQHYLRQLGLPFSTWSRAGGEDFSWAIARASHVLLAVSDDALPELAARVPAGKTVVHFSGWKKVPGALGAHPLMTFGSELRPPEFYRAIPFVVDKGVDFSRALPGFPNASFELEPAQRALYHALCALAGNSTFLLWRKISGEFRKLGLPPEILAPFLHQAVENSLGRGVPTGPVARGDWAAVEKHLDALNENPALLNAYHDFLNQAAFDGQKIPEALL